MNAVEKRDKIDHLLRDCTTLSSLLWDADEPNQETINHTGIMLYNNLQELKKSIDQAMQKEA